MRKVMSILLLASMAVFVVQGPAMAANPSLTRGAASLLVPGLGQYINGELNTQGGKIKTGAMILLEIGAIVTTAWVGGVSGYPQIWAGIGIFIFNHLWSATDAYMQAPAGPEVSLKENEVSQR